MDEYDKLLESILRLKLSPDFEVFMDWLRKLDLMISRQMSDIKDELQLRWAQGRQQDLRGIIATVNEAFEILEQRKMAAKAGKNPAI